MKLSNILPKMEIHQFTITDERDFDALAITNIPSTLNCCTFITEEKYLDNLSDSIVMVLISEDLAHISLKSSCGRCVVQDPRLLYYHIHNYLAKTEGYARKSFGTRIGLGCDISALASIARNNVVIGNHVIIEEFVVIRENTWIEDNTIIRAGTKIGGQGLEFKRENGEVVSIAHLGGVKIGSHVEIQNNCCVDRAIYPWDDTIIADFAVLDNLVHVGHAVKIGKGVIIAALSGISGSATVGEETWIGVGVIISNGVHIGNHCRVNIGSVVATDIRDGESVTGYFAIDHNRFLANWGRSSKL